MKKVYIKGFNHGYIIAKYMKTLFEKLVLAVSKLGDYGLGFQDGGKEFQREREENLLKGFSDIRENDIDNELDITK